MKLYTSVQTAQMADALKEGAVLAFPTDTVYGVGCIYGDAVALRRLKTIKRRPEEKPIPMMAAGLWQAEDLVELSDTARKLADAFLPGAMTLIVRVKAAMDRQFTNGKDTIALRVPNAPALLEVIEQSGKPLMVSSANLSGEPAALCAKEAMDMLPDLDGILDGPCKEGMASTIVDCTKEIPSVLREGPISREAIEKVLGCPVL